VERRQSHHGVRQLDDADREHPGASDLASAGTAAITVVTPAPGGGTSAASSLTVRNPAPGVTSLSPSRSGTASDPAS